jgi:glycosyltransferase involved in cell wall biosynthesis
MLKYIKELFSFPIKKTGKWILKHPHLAYFIKPYIKKYPALWAYVKQEALYSGASDENSYTIINTGNNDLYFSTGPLEEQRGIGRVAREILATVGALSTQYKKPHIQSGPSNRKKIFFYASIHWCPDQLPENSIVMIHDVIPLIFPELSPTTYNYWNTKYKLIAQQAETIVTISESSAIDISRLLDIPKEKIQVIHNGVSHLPVAQTPPMTLPTSPYIAFLGSGDGHKNIDIVLQALQDPSIKDITLVMIGDNKKYKQRAKQLGVSQQVQFLGRLEDDQVGYVLSRAMAFVFPSLYEGFGLPPLEAALLGVPSICSRRPAMTELLEGVALFAEPDKPEEWAKAIKHLQENPDFRKQLAAEAKTRVEGYTWERAGNKFMDIFLRPSTTQPTHKI